MTDNSFPRQALRLLPHVLLALAFFTVGQVWPITLPAWTHWIAIAIFAVVGLVGLLNHEGTPDMRPAFARLAGALFITIALVSAWLQFTHRF